MIDTYKEAESQDNFVFSLKSRSRDKDDEADDESSASHESSFNLKTLNINELKAKQ